ncbi:hypothetical protein A8B82_12255 [Sulfitobacter sp. EhC04]|uniref:DUF5671 domain-containing protein n=1 Tax=Sulfitobacter sp. EhC04 TaxID=1849168 RepID=UPI0007F4C4DA|nr:DUF5671 domain-containing protein [Sulfitobacter sp. EhC04]OAN77678.1 hypothetical protein A8B82_12255 [Sulfitobacter sp. EhC04]
MAVNKQLSRFVRDALSSGKTRAEISQALTDSGWSRSEVTDALDAWAETMFAPPVPRPQATLSARDFFIYALTFGVMIIGAIHLVQLFHALIDLWLDTDSYRSSGRIRWSMAVLIVTTPVYLWLTVRERGKLADDPALYRSAIRRWLMYVTLLLSAAVLLGDGIAVIYAFLSGDFTLQFFLKALVVAVVAGLIFLFYLADIRKGDAA